MIAVAVVVGDDELYDEQAAPGIALVTGDEVEAWEFAVAGTRARTGNIAIEQARGREDLEALVIIEQSTEITDPHFAAKVKAALADPQVAVAGCAGASGDHGLAWWRGEISCGAMRLRYSDIGGGETDPFRWSEPAPAPQDVDVLDGALLVLSPWAVEHLRFDERFVYDYGIDVDICLEARAAGRKVRTTDIAITVHRDILLVPDEDAAPWIESHMILARKWDDGSHGADEQWRPRARRGEAERDAARAFAQGLHYTAEAQAWRVQEPLSAIEDSFSWWLTEPLRTWNAGRRKRAAR